MNIVNAKIKSTMLGFEDHVIFTCFIHLDYGGSEQGFGGYSMSGVYTDKSLRNILKTVGVDTWEKLKGQYVRVKREEGYNGRVTEIGHLLEEKWFSFK